MLMETAAVVQIVYVVAGACFSAPLVQVMMMMVETF